MPSKFLQEYKKKEAEERSAGSLTDQAIEWKKGMLDADRAFIKNMKILEKRIGESVALKDELLEMQGPLVHEKRLTWDRSGPKNAQ